MIANVAFLAALTTFLAVAWLAGELSFLAPFKAGIFRITAPPSAPRSACSSSTSAPSTTASRAGCSCATPAASCRTWTVNWARRTPSWATSIPDVKAVGVSVMWRDIDPREQERERPDLSRGRRRVARDDSGPVIRRLRDCPDTRPRPATRADAPTRPGPRSVGRTSVSPRSRCWRPPGAFRVVIASDLRDHRGRPASAENGELRRPPRGRAGRDEALCQLAGNARPS